MILPVVLVSTQLIAAATWVLPVEGFRSEPTLQALSSNPKKPKETKASSPPPSRPGHQGGSTNPPPDPCADKTNASRGCNH